MRLLFILIVAGGIAAGWIVLREKNSEAHLSGWAKELSALMEPQARGTLFEGDAMQPDEVAFYRILHYMHRIEREKFDLRKAISEAVEKLGLTGNLASVTEQSLTSNYEMAKTLHLFDDPANLTRMETGEAPLVKLKGWNDEPVALAQIVGPGDAPKLANRLPNLVLLPAMVRDVRSGEPMEEYADKIRQFERAGLLERAQAELLLAASKPAKKSSR